MIHSMVNRNTPDQDSLRRAVRGALVLALRAGLRGQPQGLDALADELRASLADAPVPEDVEVVEDAGHRAIVAAELETALAQLRREFS